MKTYSAARGRCSGIWCLLTLSLALACRGQTARAEQPGKAKTDNETTALISSRAASATLAKRSRQESEDAEEEMIEIDPLLRLQLLSSILITSPEVLKNTSTTSVTLAPFTTQTPGDDGEVDIQGGKTPHAPEPASLVLGAVGAGITLLTTAVRRRRRRLAAAD